MFELVQVVVATIDTLENYEVDSRFSSTVPVKLSATLLYTGCRMSLYGKGKRWLGILYALSSVQDAKYYEKDCFSLGLENSSDCESIGYDALVSYLHDHVGEKLALYNEVAGKVMFCQDALAIVVYRISRDDHIDIQHLETAVMLSESFQKPIAFYDDCDGRLRWQCMARRTFWYNRY